MSTDTTLGAAYRRIDGLSTELKGALVALPPVAYLTVFFVVPLFSILNYSVRVQRELRITGEFTLAHYAEVLTSGTFQGALFYSVRVALVTTVLALVVGTPVGYYLATEVGEQLRNVLLFLVIAPLWINFFVRAYAMIQLGSPRGFLNGFLISSGVLAEPLQGLIYSQPAVVFGLVSLYLPLAVLPVYAVLREMEAAWLEAARDLGAGPLRVHREVTLPAALPGLILGGLFVFLLSLGNQAVPRILGGAKNTTYAEAILLQLEGSVNWPVAAAASGVMMVFVVVVLVAVFNVFDMEELF